VSDLTDYQTLNLLAALDAENRAARNPCPDLAEWIADCRASPSTRAWEAARWPVSDSLSWDEASLYEYSNGQLAVCLWGKGPRGVVMLSDDRFYPVHGDPGGDWSFTLGDDHGGYATLAEAVHFVS